MTRTSMLTLLFALCACTGGSGKNGDDSADGDDGSDGGSDGSDGSDGDDGGDDGGSDGGDDRTDLFSPNLERIVLELDYEPGAEPYTGSVLLGADTWDLFQVNAEALLERSPASIEAPRELEDMQEREDLSATSFDVDRILQVAEQWRDTPETDTVAVYHVLWLDGYYELDGEELRNVIAVSIGDTRVIAMFKPVIETIGSSDMVRYYGEQATLVHEFGHAVGLVDNGVDMVSEHIDEENGRHCDNNECVMFWANESSNDLGDFVLDQVLTGAEVLFDAPCMADMDAAF